MSTDVRQQPKSSIFSPGKNLYNSSHKYPCIYLEEVLILNAFTVETFASVDDVQPG